ncbi:hypothetical protein C8R46DRAFT_1031520 [Mycena filopes]|nr:hypothetical protein C8R46DRAFT_1031520 [Mycena filopes]
MELNFHCTPPPYTHLLPVYMQSHSPENGTIDPAQLLAPAQTSPYLSPTLSDDLADTDDSLFDGVDGLGVKTEPLTLSPGDPFFYQSDPLDIDMDALDSLARQDDIACGSDDEDEEEIDELASSIPATPVRPPVCPPSPPSAPISPLPTRRTSPSYPALVEYSSDEDSEDETPRDANEGVPPVAPADNRQQSLPPPSTPLGYITVEDFADSELDFSARFQPLSLSDCERRHHSIPALG